MLASTFQSSRLAPKQSLPGCAAIPAVFRPSRASALVLQGPKVVRTVQLVCKAASTQEEKPALKSLSSITSLDIYDTELSCDGEDCPMFIQSIMRPADAGLLSALPTETLEQIIPKLDKVTGMPVLDAAGKLTGVISRKDIIKVRKAKGSMKDTVAQHMTTPAISVSEFDTVAEAGELMLSKNIRRLPVVNELGIPVGIISRSDIFKPLMMEAYKEYMEREIAAIHGDDAVAADNARKTKKAVTWTIKYLYDGDCPMCQSLMTVLKRQDNERGIIKFVNIADSAYKPKNNMGIQYEEAMETIHAIQADGTVIMGTDALRALFASVGLGWVTKLSESPFVAWLVDVLYDFISANRLNMGFLGGAMDAVIASKRLQLSQKGIETCGDVDEACSVEW